MPSNYLESLDELKQHPSPISRFYEVYNELNANNLNLLNEVYRQDIQFIDPFHSMSGMKDLQHYFQQLYQNVEYCQFTFEKACLSQHHAYTSWTLTMEHPRLNKGKRYEVNGTSFLKFDDKIYFHQDYFDGGQLIYERLPWVGYLIRLIKSRMGNN